jgi:hypothetical protein
MVKKMNQTYFSYGVCPCPYFEISAHATIQPTKKSYGDFPFSFVGAQLASTAVEKAIFCVWMHN